MYDPNKEWRDREYARADEQRLAREAKEDALKREELAIHQRQIESLREREGLTAVPYDPRSTLAQRNELEMQRKKRLTDVEQVAIDKTGIYSDLPPLTAGETSAISFAPQMSDQGTSNPTSIAEPSGNPFVNLANKLDAQSRDRMIKMYTNRNVTPGQAAYNYDKTREQLSGLNPFPFSGVGAFGLTKVATPAGEVLPRFAPGWGTKTSEFSFKSLFDPANITKTAKSAKSRFMDWIREAGYPVKEPPVASGFRATTTRPYTPGQNVTNMNFPGTNLVPYRVAKPPMLY